VIARIDLSDILPANLRINAESVLNGIAYDAQHGRLSVTGKQWPAVFQNKLISKPISTLRRQLESVDFKTREAVKAAYERSDVCVVPAAGVAGEAMVALTLARSALEKFGGDSMTETPRNFKGYCQQLKEF
jgi:hypothetical protein